LFDSINEANRLLDDGEMPAGLVAAIHEISRVLGFGPEARGLDDLAADLGMLASEFDLPLGEPADMIDSMLDRRRQARRDRDFATSDRIRDRLAAIGIQVEDTADGSRWLRR
jgi:cysteinyl-tRNA synthetase